MTNSIYRNARKFLTFLAAPLAFAFVLASCDFSGEPEKIYGSISMRLPDVSSISRSVTSGGTLGSGGSEIQYFKVAVRNLTQKIELVHVVLPGATLTIDTLTPGFWDVAVFGMGSDSQNPVFYGNSRNISVLAGLTSYATVALNRAVSAKFNVSFSESPQSVPVAGRANVQKVYVTYKGEELVKSGSVFFNYSDSASQNVKQPAETDKMTIPVDDFLEPGYSYSAKVWLFGSDDYNGFRTYWSGTISGNINTDGTLGGDLKLLDAYLTQASMNAGVDNNYIKMENDLSSQLNNINSPYEFYVGSQAISYDQLKIFPAVADACGEVPVLVEYEDKAWCDIFTFKHIVVIPTVTIPDQFPIGIEKAFTEILSPAVPKEWPVCNCPASYDEYGYVKYSIQATPDKDDWKAIEYAAPTGPTPPSTSINHYYTPSGAPTHAQAVNTDTDTCRWTKTIENKTYGYFEDGSPDHNDLNGYFTVTGVAWTVSPAAIEVEKGGSFTLTLTNAAATAEDLASVTSSPNITLNAGGSFVESYTPTVSGSSLVLTAADFAKWNPASKNVNIFIGSAHAGTITVTTTPASGGSSPSVPPDFVFVEGCTINGAYGDGTGNNQSQVFITGRTLDIPNMYVCSHEVTQKEYSEYMTWWGIAESNSNKPTSDYGIGNDLPAYYMLWYEAICYCNAKSVAEGREPVYYMTTDGEYPDGYTGSYVEGTGRKSYNIEEWKYHSGSDYSIYIKTYNGKYYSNTNDNVADFNYENRGIHMDPDRNGYRLLTEAEWEYCARGGKEGYLGAKNGTKAQTKYSGSNSLGAVAWYADNSKDPTDNRNKCQTIMQLAPNDLGLYDMTGNVEEFCFDWLYNITASTPSTGEQYDYSSGYSKVARGGYFNNSDSYVKPVYGRSSYSCYRGYEVGFRVCFNAQ